MKCTYLPTQSTAASMLFLPRVLEKPEIKSIEMSLQIWVGVERGCKRLVFISLAHMTVCYKPLNVLHHTPPVKNCCNYFECAKHPHMTSHGMAVVWNSCRYPRRISRACYDRIVFFLP